MSLNVVTDASGMFYRSLFTMGNYGAKKNEKLLDSIYSQGMFIRKLATDFSATFRNIDDYSRIIICLDSHSWRKDVEISVAPGVEGEYKGDREEKKQDSPINWTMFYELCDKFAQLLGQKGYIISKVPNAEADDLLYLWSKKLNEMGENVILVTGDKDLLQTICHNENGTWTVALDPVNKRKKISLTQETFNHKDNGEGNGEVDIFNLDSWADSNDVLNKLLDSYELNIINPQHVATMKVILGDGGDSVPGIVTWPDKKDPEKIRSMTENNFGKICAIAPTLLDTHWTKLKEGAYLEEIATTMESLKKIKVNRDLVLENINRNCTLVVLNEEIIPQEVQENFKKSVEEIPSVIPVVTRDGILKGSQWWSDDKTIHVPKSFDLFGDLDD